MSPRNFSEIRLSRIAAEPIVNGIGETSDIGEPTWPRYIRITDIRGLDELKSEERMSLPPTLAAKAKVERDDIVMAAVGATVGDAYIHQSDAPACFAGYLVRFRADRSLAHPRFVAHWTQSSHYRHQIRSGYVGSTIENFSASKYRAMRIPLPALSVQREISRFLDRETAKIDALIAKQNQLIATLREDRAATITHAVTKGLKPGVAQAPSGIQWMGDVPAHWEVARLRHHATMKTGHTPSRQKPEFWENTHIPWFTLADVWQLRSGRQIYLGETAGKISSVGLANSAAELLPAGTVILSRTASVGFSGIMPIPMATSQDFWNWICGPSLIPEFLAFVFRAMKPYFDSLMMGSTHQTIYQADAAALQVPLPPVDEQNEIVEALKIRTRAADSLIDKSTEMIEVLREYRSALITNAVTGKIDVREAV
ncbi:restriction endonuclease subunit S [Dietzia sp. NPDC055343]